MASVNKVILIGHVGKDAEVRYTQSGDPIASFSLATSEEWTTKNGEKKTDVLWHKVVVFGKQAKPVGDYVVKGMAVYVEGQIVYGSYVNKDGNKVNTTEVHVKGFQSSVKFLGRPGGGQRQRQNDDDAQLGAAPAASDPGDTFVASDDDVPF